MKKTLLSLSLIMAVGVNAQNSWVPQATKLAVNAGVNTISIVDPSTVWISVYDGSGGGAYPKTFAKTTNGTTWTPGTIAATGLASSTTLVSDLVAVDANTAWIATAPSATGGTNGIFKTTNGGATWTKQTAYSSASFANVVYFWDANTGFTAGDPVSNKFEMYTTTNGGTTWTPVAGAPVPTSADDYGYVHNIEVNGNDIWLGTSVGRILHSTNKGTTWTANFTPVLDFGGNIVTGSSGKMAFKDTNNGLLIAIDNSTDAVLYSTADGGVNWDPISPTGPWYFGDITYVPGTPNTYVSTGINFNSDSFMGSSVSKDGGVTWVAIDSGEQRGTVKFLNTTTGWAGQFSDGPTGVTGILKFSGDLNLAVNEASAKNNLKVFPNPVGDVVNLTSNKEVKSVTIYDLTGKKVKSTNDTKQINVSNLAKGTYILQAYYGNGGVENTKIIKK